MKRCEDHYWFHGQMFFECDREKGHPGQHFSTGESEEGKRLTAIWTNPIESKTKVSDAKPSEKP